MSNIERISQRGLAGRPANTGVGRHAAQQLKKLEEQTMVALNRLQAQTVVRIAEVQAEGMVAKEKLREADHLAREAMVGQRMLRHWVHVLSNGDPIAADELDIFAGIARMAKFQVIQDTVDRFTR